MTLNSNDPLVAEIRKAQLNISQLYSALNNPGGVYDQLTSQGQTIGSLLQTRTNTPASPVANVLYNGEIGHSVNSWYDNAYNTTFTSKEAAWFWSHNAPASRQTFTAVTVANEIPLPGHNYTTGCRIQFTNTGGALPSGLTAGTAYYAIYLTSSSISVATTEANAFSGTVHAVSTGGTGTQTILQVLDETNQSPGSAVNSSLKTYLPTGSGPASGYNPYYCRWDSINGEAQLTGTASLDQRLPTNVVDATTPLARVSMIMARANQFIEVPFECKVGVGIWDNTVGQNTFLSGDIGFSADLVGTPVPGGITRNFRALLTSDRGFQLLSPIVTVANTPATLDPTHFIEMFWGSQSGQLQVDIYENYDPTGANTFRLIAQVSASTSYFYNGGYIADVAGYPSSTGDIRNATFFTQSGGLTGMAINGLSARWDTLNAPIEVPNNYNKGNTTGRQWVRTFLTLPLNLYIPGVGSDGTGVLTIPTGAINTAAFSAGGYGTGSTPSACLYVGAVVEVYDSTDVLLATTSVASAASDNSLTVAANIAAGTNRKIRIIGAGFHGILVDKIHLGFQQNTSYAANANDNRVLQPVAAPSSSDQGGVGGGGSGGGITCIAGNMPIKMGVGNKWQNIEYCKPGTLWATPNLRPNLLIKLNQSFDYVRGVTAANGCYIECTDTERFVIDANDENGTMLKWLRVGDAVLTEIDGRIESSKIAEITAYLGKVQVYTPELSHDRLFIGGYLKHRRWYQRLLTKLTGSARKRGGFVLHNRKNDGGDIPI